MKKVYQTSKSQTMKETKKQKQNKRESVQEPLLLQITLLPLSKLEDRLSTVNDYDTDKG